jgi:hypothetical protein
MKSSQSRLTKIEANAAMLTPLDCDHRERSQNFPVASEIQYKAKATAVFLARLVCTCLIAPVDETVDERKRLPLR